MKFVKFLIPSLIIIAPVFHYSIQKTNISDCNCIYKEALKIPQIYKIEDELKKNDFIII